MVWFLGIVVAGFVVGTKHWHGAGKKPTSSFPMKLFA